MGDRYKKLDSVKVLSNKGDELRSKTITIVGIGGVGSIVADMCVRSGLQVRLLDRDRIYENELDRQSIYLEEDVNKFKAKQSKKRLEVVNSTIKIRAFHEDLTKINSYLLDSDVVVDSSNELKTTMIINEHCVKNNIPFVYSHASGSTGQALVVANGVDLSNHSQHLENLRSGEEGVLPSAVHFTASLVYSKILKVLLGQKTEKSILDFDVMAFKLDKVTLKKNK